MRKYVFILAAFSLFSLLNIIGCENPQTQATIEELSTEAQKTENRGVWPPPAKDKEEVVQLEDNLLKKNYLFLLDASGSMSESACEEQESEKINVAKRSILEFEKLVPENANLGLIAFSENGLGEEIPMGSGPNHRKQFREKIQAILAGGGTPLSSAITLSYQKINAQARRQLGYGEYNLIVVTDGEANIGEDPTEITDLILDTSPIKIHTIGFCISEDHSLNRPGRILYKPAGNYKTFVNGLQEILAEAPVFDATTFKEIKK